MVSYQTYYAVWVLAGLGLLGVGGFALAALRYARITGRGVGRFLTGEGMRMLMGDRDPPAPDRMFSAALTAARVGLFAALPVALVTAFLTAH